MVCVLEQMSWYVACSELKSSSDTYEILIFAVPSNLTEESVSGSPGRCRFQVVPLASWVLLSTEYPCRLCTTKAVMIFIHVLILRARGKVAQAGCNTDDPCQWYGTTLDSSLLINLKSSEKKQRYQHHESNWTIARQVHYKGGRNL